MSLLVDTVNNSLGNGILHVTSDIRTDAELSGDLLSTTIFHSAFLNTIQIQNIVEYTVTSATIVSSTTRLGVSSSAISLGNSSAMSSVVMGPYAYLVYVYNSNINKGVFLHSFCADSLIYNRTSSSAYDYSASNNLYYSFQYMSNGNALSTAINFQLGAATGTSAMDFINNPTANKIYLFQTNVIKSQATYSYNIPLGEFSNDIDISNSSIYVNGISLLTKLRLGIGGESVKSHWFGGNLNITNHNISGITPDNSAINILGSLLVGSTSEIILNGTSITINNTNGGYITNCSPTLKQIIRVHTVRNLFQSFTLARDSSALILIMTTRAPDYNTPQLGLIIIPDVSLLSSQRILNIVTNGTLDNYININRSGYTISFTLTTYASAYTTTLTAFEMYND